MTANEWGEELSVLPEVNRVLAILASAAEQRSPSLSL